MQRINLIRPEQASGEIKDIYDSLAKKMGRVPNIFQAMANASAVLKTYLALSDLASQTSLSLKLREMIALAVAEATGCEYCLSAHTKIGESVGLTKAEILEARRGKATDNKNNQILKFTVEATKTWGKVSDETFKNLLAAGVTTAEIAEISQVITLNLFTNIFNHIAKTENDFPAVEKI
ncbi:MAG TPA: carboxymuconolactone decarboxylase family protein [Oligoflexia bacterium]|nr:carboxymuconolactone decarboxylase family protein [Oligoflexia bacterium]HMP26507.1 carboxymuconolactone decarboxylase family protein [Oligoflexia bacterium]